MARYLVVAHQTVTSPELPTVVRGVREQDAEAEFVLLVPATPVRHLLFRKGDEHDAEATARKRGERARAVFSKKGVPLSDVRVGAADPAEAIDQEVATHSGYAAASTSTSPGTTSLATATCSTTIAKRWGTGYTRETAGRLQCGSRTAPRGCPGTRGMK
jgi:hypothetical protein